MNNGKKKLGIALIVVIALFLISFSLSNMLTFNGTTINKIVIIPITGELTGDAAQASPLGGMIASSDTIINFIKQAENDESVRGIIIEINSPGGTVLAGKEIADALKSTNKPTVALIRDVGASGAYWAASGADKIVAHPMSITGSIGVTGSYLEFSGLMEKYGITYEELKAGKYKEEGSPFRQLTPEERNSLQERIDKIQDYFLEDIKKNRNLDNQTVEKLKEANIYLGTEAYDLKLVDYLGDRNIAINITKGLAQIEEAKIVRYEQKTGLLDLLGRLSAQSYYNIGKGIGAEIINSGKTINPLEIKA
jgi:protease-4